MRFPAFLSAMCFGLALVFSQYGGVFLNLADEVALAQSGETAVAVPLELLDRSDDLTSTLSAWTLASFVLVGFALSGSRGAGITFIWFDQLLGAVFVGSAFFSLFFGYSAKAEVLELLTYSYPSRDAFVDAYRPVKSVIASQAFCVCLVGAAAIYLAARGALAGTPRSETGTRGL